MRTVNIQADLSLPWAHSQIVGFVMSLLISIGDTTVTNTGFKISSPRLARHTSAFSGEPHVTRKPAFGVCDQVRHKPACSADETS